MKEIPLTQGKVAMVDDADFERLSAFNWYLSSAGYAARNAPRGERPRMIFLHRIVTGVDFGEEVDHINRNRLDNRKENLRICNRQENSSNKKKYGVFTSKFKGVSWHRASGKWQASIKTRANTKYLGVFKNEIDAAVEYNRAALEEFGLFASLNTIPVEAVSGHNYR